jgi:adenylate cyclase
MESDAPAPDEIILPLQTFDGALGRRIIETHIWAVREGLRGASAYDLFDGYCQRLVIHGVPLWRAHAAMETLHPQWSGYGYTWRRDLNAIHPEQCGRSDIAGQDWLSSTMYDLVRRAQAGEDKPWMRRRLEASARRPRREGNLRFAALPNSDARSTVGTKGTCRDHPAMCASGRKADMAI